MWRLILKGINDYRLFFRWSFLVLLFMLMTSSYLSWWLIFWKVKLTTHFIDHIVNSSLIRNADRWYNLLVPFDLLPYLFRIEPNLRFPLFCLVVVAWRWVVNLTTIYKFKSLWKVNRHRLVSLIQDSPIVSMIVESFLKISSFASHYLSSFFSSENRNTYLTLLCVLRRTWVMSNCSYPNSDIIRSSSRGDAKPRLVYLSLLNFCELLMCTGIKLGHFWFES